ncbi:MAG: universal stress protein [Halobacteriota archaeon]
MYSDILVPTDGSPHAKHAAKHAVGLAEQLGGTIHALYVIDDNAIGASRREADSVSGDHSDMAEAAIDEIEALLADTDVDLRTEIRAGTPHEQIHSYAVEHGIDAIVMGTRGRSGLERYVLGSVTERVIQRSDTPVLVVQSSRPDVTVTDAEEAKRLAEKRLTAEGYTDVDFPEAPSRQNTLWVVTASADGDRFNVYVENQTGDAHVARLTD